MSYPAILLLGSGVYDQVVSPTGIAAGDLGGHRIGHQGVRQWLVPGEGFLNTEPRSREWLASPSYVSEEPESALRRLGVIGIASGEACGGHRVALGALTRHREFLISGDTYLHETTDRSYLVPGGAYPTAPLAAPAVVITPSGIASGFAAGTPRLSYPQVIQPSGIATGFAAGTARFGNFIIFGGIPSGFAAGTPAIVRYILPTGIPSAEAFGTPTIHQVIQPTGIPAGAVGDPAISTPLHPALQPLSISSGFAAGTHIVTGQWLVTVTAGIASGAAFGTHRVANEQLIRPVGIGKPNSPVQNKAQSPRVVKGGIAPLIIAPLGIEAIFDDSEHIVLAPFPLLVISLTDNGIPSGFATGAHTLMQHIILGGIPPGGVGTPVLSPPMAIAVGGIPSGEAFGIPRVLTIPRPPFILTLPTQVRGRFRPSLRVTGTYRP